jgi:hypothetical protein
MTQSEALITALSDYEPHDLIELTDIVNELRAASGEKPCTQTSVSARWRELARLGVITVKPYTLPTTPNTFLYQLKRPDEITKEDIKMLMKD